LSATSAFAADSPRERINIDDNWRFTRGDPADMKVDMTLLPILTTTPRGAARGEPPAPPVGNPSPSPIWAYILPSANDLIADSSKHYKRPDGNPVANISYISPTFDDSSWRQLDLPHDFAIEGPFVPPNSPNTNQANGGTGRLPYFGQVWYRKHLNLTDADLQKQISLEIDGAMAYSVVFLNGQIVGGWPYGYSSWSLDLTPYVKSGDNVLAIRLDNPPNSSRWYPGGGIYRNVWLTKTSPIHVAHWGSYITTSQISATETDVKVKLSLENDSKQDATVSVAMQIFALNADGNRTGPAVADVSMDGVQVKALGNFKTDATHVVTITNPKLWSPKSPNRYVAVSTVKQGANILDTYETPFGIRTITYDPNKGLLVNGEIYKINGVCDHQDLGAIGSAVDFRALQRQLQLLKDMGCNAIRTSHNPPTPELLELADQMGIMVDDETFDTWRNNKTPNDYGRIFYQWHEQDTRALVRRDRNHPSVIMWSIGNEIGEQGQGEGGAAVAAELTRIVHEEDPTRPTTAAENSAQPGTPFPKAIDVLGLNYQGSRPDARNNRPFGIYPEFHQSFLDKFIYGSETASTISSRGEYTFPVAPGNGVVAGRGGGRRGGGGGAGGGAGGAALGEDTQNFQMSSYDLYYPSWATSPDTEFTAQDHFPFVAGEFVWTGFDYLGEPTPWGQNGDPARSSYFGIIDLAGFPKDRYYIYQAHWRPDFPMAHILPHWTWLDRVGQVTPVHVYTSGDEAELFLNGESLGRKKKEQFQYRIRWDDVVYHPGELKVVAYKDGKEWATDTMKTAGVAGKLELKADRSEIAGDGHDLSYITLTVRDSTGTMVPRAKNLVHFSIDGPGEIVATDNGDPTDLNIFSSHDRKAFNGLALVIVKAKHGQTGAVTITAKSDGLPDATCTITTK
jgi:beta-galactosidase